MNTKIILLVEDNLDDVDLTRDALKRAGILNELLVISDGASALDYLQRAADNTDDPELLPILMLLDLNLPKLDGFELLKYIRGDERLRRLAVVILTTSEEQEAVSKCYELYADAFLRKPVEIGRLNDAIRQAGLGWQLCEAPSTAVKQPKYDDIL